MNPVNLLSNIVFLAIIFCLLGILFHMFAPLSMHFLTAEDIVIVKKILVCVLIVELIKRISLYMNDRNI